MRTMVLALSAAGALVGVPAGVQAQAPEKAAMKNIVQVAAENGSFNTLVAAVKAAGLAATLSGKGPFTVFAPNDAAFAKLPPGTVEALLKDEEKLRAILTYHVVPARVMAADVVKSRGGKPATVNGEALDVQVREGSVYVNGAKVIAADVAASNGVIHVIDTVLLPKPAPATR